MHHNITFPIISLVWYVPCSCLIFCRIGNYGLNKCLTNKPYSCSFGQYEHLGNLYYARCNILNVYLITSKQMIVSSFNTFTVQTAISSADQLEVRIGCLRIKGLCTLLHFASLQCKLL